MNTVKWMLMILELSKMAATMGDTDNVEIVRGKT
jgi:hypothetical protein